MVRVLALHATGGYRLHVLRTLAKFLHAYNTELKQHALAASNNLADKHNLLCFEHTNNLV